MSKHRKIVHINEKSNSAESKAWYVRRIFTLFLKFEIDEYLDLGSELSKGKSMLDFSVVSGGLRAHIELAEGTRVNVGITIGEFSDSLWTSLLNEFSVSSLFLAKFLAGKITSETENICAKFNEELIPLTPDSVKVNCSSSEEEEIKIALATLYWKFIEVVQEDPFLVLSIRGMEREEIIAEIRKRRTILRKKLNEEQSDGITVDYLSDFQRIAKNFWEYPAELEEIKYSIKADELPAAVLKRLDSLPLGGLEEEVDYLLEEAYVHVATRAQAFGLGLI